MTTLLSGPSSLEGGVVPMVLISWKAWKLKRKAIASNDAEIQAALESEDSNFRTRLLWSEINGSKAQGWPYRPHRENRSPSHAGQRRSLRRFTRWKGCCGAE